MSDDWEGRCPEPMVDVPAHYRLSALLGPDGEPLKVGYARPKLGFDLTPKTKKKPFRTGDIA